MIKIVIINYGFKLKVKTVVINYGFMMGNLHDTSALEWILFWKPVYFMEFIFEMFVKTLIIIRSRPGSQQQGSSGSFGC